MRSTLPREVVRPIFRLGQAFPLGTAGADPGSKLDTKIRGVMLEYLAAARVLGEQIDDDAFGVEPLRAIFLGRGKPVIESPRGPFGRGTTFHATGARGASSQATVVLARQRCQVTQRYPGLTASRAYRRDSVPSQ